MAIDGGRRLTKKDFERWRDQVVSMAEYILANGPEVARRDAEVVEDDGYPSEVGAGVLRAPGGDHADPTGNTVVAAEDEQHRLDELAAKRSKENKPPPSRDFVHQRRLEMEAGMAEARGVLRLVERAVSLVVSASPGDPGRQNSVPLCANQHCKDPVLKPRKGRCEPCYRYREEHGGQDAGPTVISRRRARRQPA